MPNTLSIQARRGEEFPRTLTRNVDDFGDWSQIEPLYERLAGEIRSIDTPIKLAAWLRRQSELDSAVSEEGSRRYIAMTCATDNADHERAYLDFVQQVEPRLKPWNDRLARLYLDCPARQRADRERLEVLDRALANQVRLFREDNVALQTEDTLLSQQYQKLCGAMTVQWRGEERTLQQMTPLQEERDREVREEAWRVVVDRRLADRHRLDDLFDQMIDLRTRIARNADLANFRDYQHKAYDRFDYTPDDCMAFHDAIAEEVVPLLARLRENRRKKLNLDKLRPWDLAVDPEGLGPLRPFKTPEQLESGCSTVFGRLDPELAKQFGIMRAGGLLDLDSRKGKAPGGYQSTLEEVRLPFIFMNAAGSNRDVFTLLHEGGHAFHQFACRLESLLPYRHAPMEFSEVASMAMELLGMAHVDVFYPDPADAARASLRNLEGVVEVLPWIATIDAFQHWIYMHPDHAVAEREAHWLELHERFSPVVDWSDLDDSLRSMWHRQLHLYQCPFYYIEYGIAQLGALQLWLQAREDPARALKNYRRALELGGSRPLPELFEAADIRFDFTASTLRPIVKALAQAIDED